LELFGLVHDAKISTLIFDLRQSAGQSAGFPEVRSGGWMARIAEPNESRIIPQSNAARGAAVRGLPLPLTVMAGTGDPVAGYHVELAGKRSFSGG
jgi:hypothetical protein